jgi:hypothetical protein
MAWYVNLEIFRSFHYSLIGFGVGRWRSLDVAAALIWVAAPLAVLLFVGLVARIRLALALASHFSALYSACLVYGSYIANRTVTTGHLALANLWNPSGTLAVVILLASILSSTISHRSYWREIFA